MSTLKRYLQEPIKKDLKEKMVFLGGPRQVGKTTFSKFLLNSSADDHPGYLNWDNIEDRVKITKGEFSRSEKLLVFDEIHKFSKWRGLIKGFYDKFKNTYQFLVIGSARLDYYRKGGDSLLGRYYYYRLHPLSLPELSITYDTDKMLELIKFGGFPEPFLKKEETHLKRWHRQRRERIVYSDIRDLENVYYRFRILPFGAPKIKAVKKEQKIYLWDWSEIEDEGSKWENFVASHLLKFCHFIEDIQVDVMELRFLRDITCREVDFVVLKNKKPLFAVECKTGEKSLSKSITYFCERTNIPKFYQVHRGQKHYSYSDKIQLLPFSEFCKLEYLV